jgi:hypothetical protein
MILSFSSIRDSRADNANIVASFGVDENQQLTTMRTPDSDETIQFRMYRVRNWSANADLRKW